MCRSAPYAFTNSVFYLENDEEIQKQKDLSKEAEAILSILTIFLRDQLVEDAKWKRRGKVFKGFIKGLFLMRPIRQQQAAAKKMADRLESQVGSRPDSNVFGIRPSD